MTLIGPCFFSPELAFSGPLYKKLTLGFSVARRKVFSPYGLIWQRARVELAHHLGEGVLPFREIVEEIFRESFSMARKRSTTSAVM